MQYARPSILADALAILAAGGTPLAGGTLSVPEVANVAAGSRDPFFVDLAGLPSLHDVAERDGFLYVGAMVTLAEVAASTLVADSWTALAEAARAVGNPNVRRAATVGGNVAWRTGAPDLHAALLVLGGVVECATATGPLELTAEQAVDESIPAGALITSIRLPREPGRVSSFVKFAWRGASGQTIVAVAGSLDSDSRRRPLAATCRVWCDRTCRSPSRCRGPPGDAGLRPECRRGSRHGRGPRASISG